MSLTRPEKHMINDALNRGYDADELNATDLKRTLASLRRDLGKVRRALKAREEDTAALGTAQRIIMHHLARLTQRLPRPKAELTEVIDEAESVSAKEWKER